MLEIINEVKPYTNSMDDQIEFIFYTDPLCCWSWAMEESIQEVKLKFKDQVKIRYCMGGLIPSWDHYNDSINSISKPIQMGPFWMHAQEITKVPMACNIWVDDPPVSSYPACIAVKCVNLQSPDLAEKYLKLLRKALMLSGKNIASEEIIFEVANDLFKNEGTFDLTLFKRDYKNDNGLNSFRLDLQEIKMNDIARFPTIILKNKNHKGLILVGHRQLHELCEAMEYVIRN
jgi:putative protein-disulfide isomerase